MEKIEKFSQRRLYLRLLLSLGFLALLVFGISSCNFPDIGSLLPVNNPTEIPPVEDTTPTPQPTSTPDIPLVTPRQLILWLPPQFDPGNETTAGDLFSSRLDEFVTRRPQTELQVRIKTLSGEFGLLDSLQLTEAAAPLLMPDIVALPRYLLESALQAGLVIPLDEYSNLIAENDWYEYALNMALIDDQTAGIPFAGDLMVLAYKDDTGDPPPTNWNELLEVQRALAFPASETSGLVTLAWYQSLGGTFQGEDGELALDGEKMLEVLTLYQQAQNANVMPYWLTQFESDEQSWTSYLDRQSTLALTWSSRLLGSDSPNTSLAAIPTKDARAFAYGDGWVWCVVPSDQETEAFAIELVEFLSESDFLRDWTYQAGYLPVRPTGLETWTEMPYYPMLEKLLPVAVLAPEEDAVGLAVRDAVVAVLKDQVDPETALETLLVEVQE